MKYICGHCKYSPDNNGTGRSCLTYREDKGINSNKCNGNYSEFKSIDKEVKIKKQVKIKYDLTKEWEEGFSIYDIIVKVKNSGCKPIFAEFIDLIEEADADIFRKSTFVYWSRYKTICNNVEWLMKEGFIKEMNYLSACHRCKTKTARVISMLSENKRFYIVCGSCGIRTGYYFKEIDAVFNWNKF